jgi:hypothetical protein
MAMLRVGLLIACLCAFTVQSAEPKDALIPTHAETSAQSAEQPGLLHQWWFWTVIGALAFGGFTAGALLISIPQPRTPTLGSGDFR